MYYVVTLGINIPDYEDINFHLEKLEEMGYSVNMEYDEEDEES